MTPASNIEAPISKVPEATALFWLVKILATTLGETGGDAISMTLGAGYAVGSVIFFAIFAGFASAQIAARRYHPVLYWGTILASTMVGTTLADLADRSLGLGYAGGTTLLIVLLVTCFGAWRLRLGTIDATRIATPAAERFYWMTIMLSQTLGTALGDWTADSAGRGYLGSAILFSGLLLGVLAAWRWTTWSRTALFWIAFVLTRPLGAVVGDFLDKPLDAGGLALGRFAASAVLLVAIVVLLAGFPQRAARTAH